MSIFNFFKKQEPDWVTLPKPDDSIAFFETIKLESEKFWLDAFVDKRLYGFQIQPGTKWRPGLTDKQIEEFERVMGVSFPTPLRNFYMTMNGLTKPGINVYGNTGTPPAYQSVLYSFPEDINVITEKIEWIYEATCVKEIDLKGLGISKIFPVFLHRFMLVDHPDHPILSMYGEDIIYYADSLSKLLANEIFCGVIYNVWDFESPPQGRPEIKFWMD